jgi:hypothetical protein
MICDENPRPGIAVFQSTFFVSLHSVGRSFSVEMPWLSGPRHWAQFELDATGLVFAGVGELESNAQTNDE